MKKENLTVSVMENGVVTFNNGAVGFMKDEALTLVRFKNKKMTSEKMIKKYVNAVNEYNNPIVEVQEENKQEEIEVQEENNFVVENFDLFDNILEPPTNRDGMKKFIDDFTCEFPQVGKNYNVIIDDTCSARKDMDEDGNITRYTVFTLTCDSKESIELSMSLKANMWALMGAYLRPYIEHFGLVIDTNDRITDTEVRSDLVFPYIKGMVSNLRKYVHIAYFLAKKEIKSQYKEKIFKTLQENKKEEKIS